MVPDVRRRRSADAVKCLLSRGHLADIISSSIAPLGQPGRLGPFPEGLRISDIQQQIDVQFNVQLASSSLPRGSNDISYSLIISTSMD